MGYLKVSSISKAYRRYKRKSGRALEWIGVSKQHDLKWILKDISFEVAPGEAVAILGINGAGKSTLLKLIAGTARPTSGTIAVGGRIAALLELGLGFHPDFTGRQNVYLAAQLHGLAPDEIDKKIVEIEEFAEIGDYIDQPVRTYSSGMQVRLAFSVATAVRPEILIVDEALSVGDTYFQHKSFDKIRQFREEGTTLLFVSHSAGAIKTLCNRTILLDGGMIVQDGAPDHVLDYYNAMIAKKHAHYEIMQVQQSSGERITRSGSREAIIIDVDLLAEGKSVRAISSRQSVSLKICGKVEKQIEELTVGILIRDRLGNDVFGTNTFYHNNSRVNLNNGERFTVSFDFPSLDLGAGSFSVTVALHSREAHISANYDWWDRAIVFQVVPSDEPVSVGVCNFPVTISWH